VIGLPRADWGAPEGVAWSRMFRHPAEETMKRNRRVTTALLTNARRVVQALQAADPQARDEQWNARFEEARKHEAEAYYQDLCARRWIDSRPLPPPRWGEPTSVPAA
jgi:hypothetical protein